MRQLGFELESERGIDAWQSLVSSESHPQIWSLDLEYGFVTSYIPHKMCDCCAGSCKNLLDLFFGTSTKILKIWLFQFFDGILALVLILVL